MNQTIRTDFQSTSFGHLTVLIWMWFVGDSGAVVLDLSDSDLRHSLDGSLVDERTDYVSIHILFDINRLRLWRLQLSIRHRRRHQGELLAEIASQITLTHGVHEHQEESLQHSVRFLALGQLIVFARELKVLLQVLFVEHLDVVEAVLQLVYTQALTLDVLIRSKELELLIGDHLASLRIGPLHQIVLVALGASVVLVHHVWWPHQVIALQALPGELVVRKIPIVSPLAIVQDLESSFIAVFIGELCQGIRAFGVDPAVLVHDLPSRVSVILIVALRDHELRRAACWHPLALVSNHEWPRSTSQILRTSQLSQRLPVSPPLEVDILLLQVAPNCIPELIVVLFHQHLLFFGG